MRQFLARFTVIVLLLGVASCSGDGADYTWLRVVNAVPDSPTLTANWDKYVFRRDVAFGNATAEGGESLLKSFGSSAQITVRYRDALGDLGGTLLTENVAIAQDSTSTVIIAGPFDAPEAITLVSPRLPRPLAALSFQFVHAALDIGAVDVYVTAPDTELTSTAPIATLQPRGASSALEVPFGSLRIRLTQAGTLDVLFDTGSTDFPQDPGVNGPGAQWLMTIAPNVAAGSSPLFLVTTNGRTSSQLFDADTSAVLRAYHASRARTAVDVFTAVDPEPVEGEETPPAPELDQLLYSGLSFRERSPLVPLPTGLFRLAFRESGAEDPAAIGLPRFFIAGTEYSTFLYRASEADAVVINDSSTRAIATQVRLRFAHMALGIQFLTFYLSETEAGATDAENIVIRDLLPGLVSTHLAGRPNDYFLTVTERFYTTATEAQNAEETVIFGPEPLSLAGGDVITWAVFQGDAEDDPPVVLQFDDRLP